MYVYEVVSKTTSTGGGSSSSVTVKNKRKKDASSDDASDSSGSSDDSEMDRCEDIIARRFQKWPKSLLKEGLKFHKDKTTGTKKEMAERLATIM
eukprot:3604239-Prymnesium_polylepis.1